MGRKDSYSISIDFGTSNLKTGIYTGGKAKIQKLSKDINGKYYEPNIITRCRRKDGTYFYEIGSAAEKELYSPDAENKNMKFVFNVKKHLCDEKWDVVFQDGLRANAIELTSEIFSWVNNRIVTMKGGNKPEKTIITVPVTYSEMQAARIRSAAEAAGINIDAVISEPVAAVFAIDECSEIFETDAEDEEKYVFILDIGGGTIDAALIKITVKTNERRVSVLSSSGIRYGGSDLTNSIINDIIVPSLSGEYADIVRKMSYRFYHDVDNEKIRMYIDEDESANGYCFFDGEEIEYEFTDSQICAILDKAGIKQQIIKMIDDMLEDEALEPDEVSIHFIGGGSCINYFRSLLEDYFGTELDDFDDEESSSYVAVGAALYAGILADDRDIKFENRSAYQIIGEFDDNVVYLNRNELYGNKTIKKPLSLSYDGNRKYMRFYQRFDNKSKKIYLGYLDLSDEKYNNGVLFDLMILSDGRIEAEIYGQDNESLGKEKIISEEL